MASNKESKIASKYSKALLRAYLTNSNLRHGQVVPEAQAKELKLMALGLKDLAQAVTIDRDTLLFFQNPTILVSSKEQVVSKVLESIKAEKLLSSFVMSALKNGRFEYLPGMANAFSGEVRNILSVLAVKVTTAREMSLDQKEDISKLVASKSSRELEFSWHIDSSLFGGVILEYDGKRYDSSISGRLESIRSQIKF